MLQVEGPLQILGSHHISIDGYRRIVPCGRLGLVGVPAGVIWPIAR